MEEQALKKRIAGMIAEELQVKLWQVEAAVDLIDEGNTIPFIARYRKEATGTLDDEQLRTLDERLTYLRNLEEKKQKVIESIEAQGKLTKELRDQIEEAQTQVAVEDLYRPYRPKRRTRASVARERGLQGLADWLISPGANHPALEEAAKYISEENEVPTAEDALQGAKDIIAETISDNADYRTWIRENTAKDGFLITAKKETSKKDSSKESSKKETSKKESAGRETASKESSKESAKESAKAGSAKESGSKKKAGEDRVDVYEMYFEYEEQISKIPGHRVLAINRGEKEGYLSVSVEAPREKILRYLKRKVITRKKGQPNTFTAPVLEEVCEDSYDRLICPAIEREIRNELTEKAEDGAIVVFKQNLEQLLMQQPVAGKVVLGWDPAFRTGCKLAVVDPTGKVLDTAVIYPTAPQNKVREAEAVLQKLIAQYDVTLFSVGNGTASRESEQVITSFFKKTGKPLQYVIVNEAGASVYSASKLATEEFPLPSWSRSTPRPSASASISTT